jgi:hypothetical protein
VVSGKPREEYSPEGYLVGDYTFPVLQPVGGPPVRRKMTITRTYYVPSEVELQNIVRDFLAYVADEQRTTVYYRNPVRYGRWDEYLELSLRDRRGEDVTQYIRDHFRKSPRAGEVLRALRLRGLPLDRWR